MKKLSIIVPAHNEENTVKQILTMLVGFGLPGYAKEIILVEDGSQDKTYSIAKEFAEKNSNVKVIRNEINIGKSQSVKKGILASSGELVVVQDADLEYVPAELTALVEKLDNENLDVVYGNRYGKKNKFLSISHYWGNRFVSIVSNIFTFLRIRKIIPDMEVCYKLIKGDIARNIASRIKSKTTFGIEPEITARLAKYKIDGKRLKFGIVPITYLPRTKKEGKKLKAFSDGFKALKEIVYYNLLEFS